MAEFSKLIMTERGKELLNNGMLAEDSLEFMRAVLSAHVYAEEELGDLESLEEVWRGIPVRSTTVEKGAVTVDFMVSNENMESGHFIRAVGLYAKARAGEEVLFAAAVEKSGGCYMPKHSETVTSLQVKLRFRIDNAERVMLMVDAGGTAAMGDVLEVRSLVLEEAGRAETAETELKRQIEAEVGRASEREAALEDAKLDKDGDASGVTVDFQPSKQSGPPEPLQPGGTLGEQFGRLAKAVSDLASHLEDGGNPHKTTKAQVGLGNVDNTADMDKPVSAAQQEALDALYAQMAAYADKKTADLINGAPSTLDTLGEIAQAMGENADVVSALEAAIGTKAGAEEFESHVKDKTAHVTEAERREWNSKLPATGGEISGSLKVGGSIFAGNKTEMWTDSEGGNIEVTSPGNIHWQMDAFNDDFRLYSNKDGDICTAFSVGRTGGMRFRRDVDINGRLCLPAGSYAHRTDAGQGRDGCIAFARIRIETGYCDAPIGFRIIQRDAPRDSLLYVRFSTTDHADPELSQFVCYGYYNDFYITKEAASTWKLCAYKGGSGWQNIDVMELIRPNYDNISVEWLDEYVGALPDGCTKASSPESVTGIKPYFVAASDAPPQEKAAAKYVCIGTDDQQIINQAIEDIYNSVYGGQGGAVELSSGTFYISGNIELEPTMTLKGQDKSTELYIQTNKNVFSLNTSSCLKDFRIVRQFTDWAGFHDSDYIINVGGDYCVIDNIYFSAYDERQKRKTDTQSSMGRILMTNEWGGDFSIIRNCVFNDGSFNLNSGWLQNKICLTGHSGYFYNNFIGRGVEIIVSGSNNYLSVGAYKSDDTYQDDNTSVNLESDNNMIIRLTPYICILDKGSRNTIK